MPYAPAKKYVPKIHNTYSIFPNKVFFFLHKLMTEIYILETDNSIRMKCSHNSFWLLI